MSCGELSAWPQSSAAVRMVDSNLNRATEGLRIVEDYCRFALNDAHLTARCKALRHDLVTALHELPAHLLAFARETQIDVGTAISTPQEQRRESLAQIASASWQRVHQALRVIEECLKLTVPAAAAAQIEALRYESYTLAKACSTTAASLERLSAARLYVLIGGGSSECALAERVRELVAAGVHVLQLRDKQLDDRTLLARARLVRRVIDESAPLTTHHAPPPTHHLTGRSLFIMNDRPDIAVLARADGVHVGQEELTVHDVRQIVGPDSLIGVSTHTIEQARQAVLDGANYIGCGPTFASGTKHFDHFPGLDFLRQVAAEIALPAFAIGGITANNLAEVLATGFTRAAASGAISTTGREDNEIALFLTALKSRAYA